MQKSRFWLNKLTNVESPNITHMSEDFPIVMRKGRGMYVTDVDRKRYLDFTACFGVLALGHRPKVVLKALRQQSAQMIHGMGDVHPTESKIRLLIELAKHLPFEHTNSVLASGGAEAIDAALKTAVLATGKTQFLSFQGAYHGLLTGPLRLLNRKHFTEGFCEWMGHKATILPFPYSTPPFYCEHESRDVDFFQQNHQLIQPTDCLNQLEDEMKKGCYAGVVIEPIQGRGGDRCFPDGFIKSCYDLAKQYNVKLIFDEIFTGFGRTGPLFAYEDLGITPDIICLGKALGGGLPLSACAGDILEVWGKSHGEARHTSTFLGHPLACATGHASIKAIVKQRPIFLEELEKIEMLIQSFINKCHDTGIDKKHPFWVTGKGFMRGFWFYQEPGFAVKLTKQLLKKGFIVLPSGPKGDVLSLTPPLIATTKMFEKLFAALMQILC